MKTLNNGSSRSGWARFFWAGFLMVAIGVIGSCGKTEIVRKLPPKRLPSATLTTRLAVLVLHGLTSEALNSTEFMPALHENAERGARGMTPRALANWSSEVYDSGYSIHQAFGPNGLRGINYAPALRLEGFSDLDWEKPSRFDAASFEALDRQSWRLFLAELEPEGTLSPKASSLKDASGGSPTTYGFAVSALDHEIRRLIYQVGSHLTLITIADLEESAAWTVSGPGSDDKEVQASLQEGRLGDALGRLLGFEKRR